MTQEEQLLEYRKWLVAAEQKSQEDFDKTVLSLSGGALGISFVFLKDVVGTNPILQPSFLFTAWIAWAFSTFAVLVSYFLSHLALRHAIAQVDTDSIYSKRPGGLFAQSTAILNALGAILFLLGVCLITAFASANLSAKGEKNVGQKASVTTTTASAEKPSVPAAATDQRQPGATDGGIHPSATTPSTATKK